MKIAFLIIAHEYPESVARLVLRLQSPDADIFIHVDAKKNIEDFRSALPDGTKAVFIENRVSVNHGGYSQPMSMLSLLKEVAKGEYDVYQILSGRDYPVRPVGEIVSFFAGYPHTDFMDHYPLTPDAPMAQNISQYHFVDYIAKLSGKTRHLAVRFKQKLNDAIGPRKFIKGYEPHRGSCWFALSHSTVQAILRFLETPAGRKYSRFFRFSWGSDEIFFQTLVLRFRPGGTHDYLHYIDWDKTRENPAVLDDGDFDRIARSGKLFIRKTHPEKSAALLDRLDSLAESSRHQS